MNKSKIRKNILESYSYGIPTVVLIFYVLYIVFGIYGKAKWNWIGDSTGFKDMCTLITQFSSIVLGVYGFFIPVEKKKKDSFTDYFWQHIDRDRFARDVHKIILSGIIAVLISVFLTVSDIMSKPSVFVLMGILIWILIFYVCNTYRFLGIFIHLIVGNSILQTQDSGLEIETPISESKKEKINSEMKKF